MESQIQDIYVYRIANNKIVEIPAYIIISSKSRSNLCEMAYDRDNRHPVCEVAMVPGMVFNGAIWFEKKSFKKAKKIFLSDISAKLKRVEKKRSKLRDELGFISGQKEVM